MRQRDSIGELAQQQGREGGKGDLANGLMLTVLIDDGEVASGALGQFVEILVSTWLHPVSYTHLTLPTIYSV